MHIILLQFRIFTAIVSFAVLVERNHSEAAAVILRGTIIPALVALFTEVFGKFCIIRPVFRIRFRFFRGFGIDNRHRKSSCIICTVIISGNHESQNITCLDIKFFEIKTDNRIIAVTLFDFCFLCQENLIIMIYRESCAIRP